MLLELAEARRVGRRDIHRQIVGKRRKDVDQPFVVIGRILDQAPGLEGHQHYFLFLAGVALSGLAVIAWLSWLSRRNPDRESSAR